MPSDTPQQPEQPQDTGASTSTPPSNPTPRAEQPHDNVDAASTPPNRPERSEHDDVFTRTYTIISKFGYFFFAFYFCLSLMPSSYGNRLDMITGYKGMHNIPLSILSFIIFFIIVCIAYIICSLKKKYTIKNKPSKKIIVILLIVISVFLISEHFKYDFLNMISICILFLYFSFFSYYMDTTLSNRILLSTLVLLFGFLIFFAMLFPSSHPTFTMYTNVPGMERLPSSQYEITSHGDFYSITPSEDNPKTPSEGSLNQSRAILLPKSSIIRIDLDPNPESAATKQAGKAKAEQTTEERPKAE